MCDTIDRLFPERALALALSMLLAPAAARAQSTAPELIRGRVSNDSTGPIAGASVIVTRGPDRFVQQTTTDSMGLFRVRFEQWTGVRQRGRARQKLYWKVFWRQKDRENSQWQFGNPVTFADKPRTARP
jgi:hypothetical protein